VTTGFLLDANVLGELRLARTGNENVIALVDSIPRNLQFISVITLLEVEQGVLRKERQDPAQGANLRIWLDNAVRPNFSERILPVTETVALCCARLHVPDKKPERDALIAATALVHDLAVVTRNVKDFSPMNVAVLNPWD
jgi:toxin FitB